ncbi:alpha-L-rhamnosidase C-terminal domain-containing protein [Humibacter ginsengisoli]
MPRHCAGLSLQDREGILKRFKEGAPSDARSRSSSCQAQRCDDSIVASRRIALSWRTGDGGFTLEASVPEGVPATIVLPDSSSRDVRGGDHSFSC